MDIRKPNFHYYLAAAIVSLFFFTHIASALERPTINSLRSILLSEAYTEVPIQLATYGNVLVVDVAPVNGPTQLMVLDTGSAFSSISRPFAEQLGARFTGERRQMGGDSGRHTLAFKAVIPSLKVADFLSHNEAFYVRQKDFSALSIDKRPIVGLLGLDYLMAHQAIIDIAGRHLYLKPMDIYEDEPIALNYKTIPLIYTPSGHVAVKAIVNNAEPAYFLLDTGVPELTLSTDYATQLALKANSAAATGEDSDGGHMTIYHTKINKLRVGSINSTPRDALITSMQYAQVGLPLAGVIGLDWLQQHAAIIDMQRDTLYVR